MSAYYTGTSASTLIEQYRIDIHPNSLYKTFPLEKNIYKPCMHCHSCMYLIPPPKSAPHRKEYICPTCKHTEGILKCTCEQCENRHKIETITEQFGTTLFQDEKCGEAKTLDSMHLVRKAYLGALLRTYLSPKGLMIDLNGHHTRILAPSSEYSEAILEVLIANKLIIRHTAQNIEETSFMFNRLHPDTLYSVCIDRDGRTEKELLLQLMFPDPIPFREEEDYSLLHLLSDVQTCEAIEYMRYCMAKFNLHAFHVDDRFEFTFSDILLKYSLSQLFNFIYTTVRNLAAYRNQNQNRYIDTAGFIHRGIQTKYEKARKHDWTITDFDRPWDLPQSELSKLLNDMYNKISSTFYSVIS